MLYETSKIRRLMRGWSQSAMSYRNVSFLLACMCSTFDLREGWWIWQKEWPYYKHDGRPDICILWSNKKLILCYDNWLMLLQYSYGMNIIIKVLFCTSFLFIQFYILSLEICEFVNLLKLTMAEISADQQVYGHWY